MWEARLKALRTANAKQVVNRSLDRLDPVGIRTELDPRKGAAPGARVLKGGHVIDFYRATAAEYPDDVVVARVGDFYEAYGLSAVMLIEHGNLNPMGGWNARAGMPIANIQKTLDDLVAAGLSVTVCEERDPPKGKRKERFVTERIHANNPQYLYNSLAREGDGTVPRDAVPFVGVVRDSAGAMRVVVVDPDNRTVGTSAPCSVHAELDSFIPRNSSVLFVRGSVPPEVAPGVRRRTLPPIDSQSFAEAVVGAVCEEVVGFAPSDFRSDPLEARRLLHATTAAELGVAEQRPGVPRLLDHLAHGAVPPTVRAWYKRLLNNPPRGALPPFARQCRGRTYFRVSCAGEVREAIRQLLTYLLSDRPDALPQLPTVHMGNVVRSIRTREATPRLLAEVRTAADSVAKLMGGLDEDVVGWMRLVAEETARVEHVSVEDLAAAVARIDLSLEPEHDGAGADLPEDCGAQLHPAVAILVRKKEKILRRARGVSMGEVSAARSALNTVVTSRLTPEQSDTAMYEYRTGSVAVSPGRGARPVGGEGPWTLVKARSGKDVSGRWTSPMLSAANEEYNDAVDEAERSAMEAFREVCDDLHSTHFDAVSYAIHFCQAFEALRMHADSAQIRQWTVPEACAEPTAGRCNAEEREPEGGEEVLPVELQRLTPYWMDRAAATTVTNDFGTGGMALLTAANMSGKSTLLRAVTAACLLANCGLCVPAEGARVPAFDVIFLRNAAYDAPAEGKSSFGVEMSDVRDLLAVATSRSLVMVDELGKGTSSSEGAALSAAILEHFGRIGCVGIFASHLFELFELPMKATNLDLLTMEVVIESDEHGRRRVEWTYRLKAGQADSSLALDAARHFDVPDSILDRAHELLEQSSGVRERMQGVPSSARATTPAAADGEDAPGLEPEPESDPDRSELVRAELSRVSKRKRVLMVPPSWAVRSQDRRESAVYALRLPSPDGRWYVGETTDMKERLKEHRGDPKHPLKAKATLHYVTVRGQDRQRVEKALIVSLKKHGVPMLSTHDGGRKRMPIGES